MWRSRALIAAGLPLVGSSKNDKLDIYDPDENARIRHRAAQVPSVLYPYVSAAYDGYRFVENKYTTAKTAMQTACKRLSTAATDFQKLVPPQEQSMVGVGAILASAVILRLVTPKSASTAGAVKRFAFINLVTAGVAIGFYPNFAKDVFQTKVYPRTRQLGAPRPTVTETGGSLATGPFARLEDSVTAVKASAAATWGKLRALFPGGTPAAPAPVSEVAPATASETVEELFPVVPAAAPRAPSHAGLQAGDIPASKQDRIAVAVLEDMVSTEGDLEPDYGQSNLEDLKTYK